MGAACESEHTEYGRCALPAGHGMPHAGYASGEWHDPKLDPYEQAAKALGNRQREEKQDGGPESLALWLTPRSADTLFWITEQVMVKGSALDDLAEIRSQIRSMVETWKAQGYTPEPAKE